jgi:GNAT superfamily N-acetyltransferase
VRLDHNCNVPSVVLADKQTLDRVLEATHPICHNGLNRRAYSRFHAAQVKTPWGSGHQRLFALVDGALVLASAKRYDFRGILDQKAIHISGLGAVFTDPAHRGQGHGRALIERLLADAVDEGADLALLFSEIGTRYYYARMGFEALPTPPMTAIRVSESARHGAPMTMIRGGEARDLDAIVAMGRERAGQFRFHLDRDVSLVQYAVTKKRLLAGLGRAGERELQFFIAEEGTTAAAYVVISVAGQSWTIEECGDRDRSGARVGAILQALIAREPVERRPTISAWLPPGFAPPQVTLTPSTPSAEVMMMRDLRSAAQVSRLSEADVLYWRSDLF